MFQYIDGVYNSRRHYSDQGIISLLEFKAKAVN